MTSPPLLNGEVVPLRRLGVIAALAGSSGILDRRGDGRSRDHDMDDLARQ